MPKIDQPAEIVREYGPFPGVSDVAGVSFDGRRVWFAAGETLRSFDPASGCLLYTSPSPRDGLLSRMPSSA